MMKRTLLVLAMLVGTLNVFAQAPEYLPEWKEGYLDIHTIATGRGDAALIVMPDGTSMMIDAGDNAKAKDTQHPDNTKKPGEWQAIYMKQETVHDGSQSEEIRQGVRDQESGSER